MSGPKREVVQTNEKEHRFEVGPKGLPLAGFLPELGFL